MNRRGSILKVVDSNQLQSQSLRSFLSASSLNFAVLTDYAAMEAYKGDTLTSIFKSMEILSESPSQVIVLKSTMQVSALRRRKAGLRRRLIDQRQTDGFPAFVAGLRRAESGDFEARKQLLENGREATEHFNLLLRQAAALRQTLDQFASVFTKAERKLIRDGSPLPLSCVGKIMKEVLLLAQQGYRDHPRTLVLPPIEELPNAFIFRVALCTFLQSLFRVVEGSVKLMRPENLRNDMVDATFAAYSTYFDGVLSSDRMVQQVSENARAFLMAIEAA